MGLTGFSSGVWGKFTFGEKVDSLLVKSEFTFGVRFGVKLAKIVVPPLAGKFTFSLSLSVPLRPEKGNAVSNEPKDGARRGGPQSD